MADSEPVIAPDQLKTGPKRAARVGVIGSALVLLAMVIGNHEGNTENIFLIVTAVLLLSTLVVDSVLRRNGLR
jgi:hypothetical protein